VIGPIAEAAPRRKARIAGTLYLIVIVTGLFAVVVLERLVVHGNAAATAHNIVAHELLFRSGFVANIVVLPCNVVLALIFFDLFAVVNRSLALLVAFFILTATAIEGVNLLNQMAPVVMLTDGLRSGAFNAEQLHAQAYLPLELHPVGFTISLVLYGCYDIVAGYLIVRSTFLPRILGVLLAIGGLCYIANGFGYFIAPGFAAHLFPYILMPSFVGEASLTGWLLAVGLNPSAYRELATWRTS